MQTPGLPSASGSFRAHTISQPGKTSAQVSLPTRVEGNTMRSQMLFENMLKRPLFLAVAATFVVAGCSTTKPMAEAPVQSYVGPTGAAGPAGPAGERGPTGATGAQGIA